MKRSILFGKYLVAVFAIALIVQTGCKKEKGYYASKPVANTSSLTAYDYLKSKTGIYDSLLLVVNALGYEATLKDSSVTVFAPSNQSFTLALSNLNTIRAGLGQDPIYLSQLAAGGDGIADAKARNKANRDKKQLDTLVSMYIVRNQYVSNDFAIGDGQGVNSVRNNYPMHGQRIYSDAEGFMGGGSALIQYADTKRSLFVSTWATANTSSVDIKTKNAVVNLLNNDHVFGFDSFVARMTVTPAPPSVIKFGVDTLFPTWPAASGYYDGQISTGEVFRNLFDNNVGTKFICNTNGSNNWYVTMWFIPVTPAIVNSYSLTSANDSKGYRERDPRSFRLEGTLDMNARYNTAAKWVALDVRQDQDFTTNYQTKRYEFNNTVAYRAYRLVLLQIGTGLTSQNNLFQISEWTMNYQDPNQ